MGLPGKDGSFQMASVSAAPSLLPLEMSACLYTLESSILSLRICLLLGGDRNGEGPDQVAP